MANRERHPDVPPMPKARLIAIGGSKPREYPLRDQPLSIGSDTSNDIVIDDSTASRHHATIAWREGHVELADLKSTNGTYVGGARVHGTAVLSGGEEVRFGAVRFVLMRNNATLARGSFKPGRFAMLVAAMFAVGFAGVRYRSEIEAAGRSLFAQMLGATAPAPVPASIPTPTATAAAPSPTPAPTPPGPEPGWLKRLNYYRTMAKLTPVAEDIALSKGDELHAEYMVNNYRDAIMAGSLGAEMHSEEPGYDGYTPEGLAAAQASDMNTWYSSGTPTPEPESERTESAGDWGTPEWSIDEWMAVPFHRIPMLAPDLAHAGFGQYCDEGVCAAGINLANGARGNMPPAGASPWPIEFPPNNSTITLLSTGDEYPDPRVNCPGYEPPSGLAITLMLGRRADAHLADYQVIRRGAFGGPVNVEACGFDSSSYDNPDGEAQQRARAGLSAYGAIVILPRDPLERGATYDVSVTANGRGYQWSFSIAR